MRRRTPSRFIGNNVNFLSFPSLFYKNYITQTNVIYIGTKFIYYRDLSQFFSAGMLKRRRLEASYLIQRSANEWFLKLTRKFLASFYLLRAFANVRRFAVDQTAPIFHGRSSCDHSVPKQLSPIYVDSFSEVGARTS